VCGLHTLGAATDDGTVGMTGNLGARRYLNLHGRWRRMELEKREERCPELKLPNA